MNNTSKITNFKIHSRLARDDSWSIETSLSSQFHQSGVTYTYHHHQADAWTRFIYIYINTCTYVYSLIFQRHHYTSQKTHNFTSTYQPTTNFEQFYIAIYSVNSWDPTECVCLFVMHCNRTLQYCIDSPTTVENDQNKELYQNREQKLFCVPLCYPHT